MHTVITTGHAKVVGSFGSLDDLQASQAAEAQPACDLIEIRLDLLSADALQQKPSPWKHLKDLPLLFTARRHEEGGAQALDAEQRMKMLEAVLDDASLIDIEVASISEMAPLIQKLEDRNLPWVASFHDFQQLPTSETIVSALDQAVKAGASAFKLAAKMNTPADVARLADFQLASHAIPTSTMGMGELAPVSRLLCAQCGSVLNYGYMGDEPTAPGQWSASKLKQAITDLAAFRANQ